MSKVDCIVLGGGNLVIGKRKRSHLLKGSEQINQKELASYILDTLNKKREEIGKIVYLGDNISNTVKGDITYIPPAVGKGFLPSLQLGTEALKVVGDTKNEVVLVICGDIPLINEEHIDFLLQSVPTENNYLTLFGVNNSDLQEKYPDYNQEKRFLELQESDFIFGNAFLVKKEALSMGLEKILQCDENGLKAKKVMKFLTNLGWKNLLVSLKLIIFGNIKFFDGKIPSILKKIGKPKLSDLKNLIEEMVGKKGIEIINNAPSELVVDYDRKYQLPFFSKYLKN